MLSLLVAPSAPQNVAAVHTTSSSITWTWDPPANHGNKVTYYQISYYLYYWLSNGATTNGTYYQMSELSGNSHYCFQARAVTGSGNYGYWSSWHCRTTLPASMPGTLDYISCIDIAFYHFGEFIVAFDIFTHSSIRTACLN